MSTSSTASRHDDRTRRESHDLYTLNAASQDSTLQAILQLFKSLMGGDSPFLQELALLANAVTGLGNGGVSSHAQVTTAVRRHGITGMSFPGTPGTIGGADIVSESAAAAIHKQVMSTFLDPVTKQTTGQARGLSQEELGKAVALAIRSGHGSQGAIVAQGEDGSVSVGGEGQAAALSKFEGEVGKTASLLKSIKSFLGSPALQNLDSTIGDLFGGSSGLSALGTSGAQAQLQRMMTFSNVMSPEDPNKSMSFLVDGIAAGVAQNFAGPGVGAEEAKARYGTAGTTSAVNLGIDGRAGARGSAAAARAEKPEDYIGERSLEDITESRTTLTGTIMREEQELMVASYRAKLGNADAKKEYKVLEQNLVAAGNDNEKVFQARTALSNFVIEQSGGLTVEGHDLTAIARSAGVQKTQSAAAYKIMQKRSGEVASQTLVEESGALGMTPQEAATVATGFVNLTGVQQTHLQELVQTGKIEGAGGAKEYIQKELKSTLENTGINVEAFTTRITSGAYAGKKADRLHMAAQIVNQIPHFVSAGDAAAEQRTQLLQSYRDIKGASDSPDVIEDLISGALGQATYTDSQVLRAMEGSSAGAELDTDEKGDIKDTKANREKMRGITGEDYDLSDPVEAERARQTLEERGAKFDPKTGKTTLAADGALGGAVERFQLDKEGKIAATAANAAELNRLTGSKDFTAKSLAEDGGQTAMEALKERGKISIEGTGVDGKDELLFATTKEFDKTSKEMTTKGQQNYLDQLADLTGKDHVKWDPSKGGVDGKGLTQEDYEKAKKDMLSGFDSGKANSALATAQEELGSGDKATEERGQNRIDLLKDVLGSDAMSDSQKEAYSLNLEKQIAEETASMRAISDNPALYEGGDTDGKLTVEGQRDFDASFKKKKGMEELYDTMGKGKGEVTQQVMRVVNLIVNGMTPNPKD